MYDCTIIGEIYQDHIFSGFATWPTPGEEIFTEHYEWELGGGAATTACALARLGRKVQLIGIAGEADLPRIAARLADFGVSATNIVPSRLRTGITVGISTVHDRSFFTHRGANDELPDLLLQNEALLQSAAGSWHIHLAMPLSAQLAAHLVPLLRQQGATTSLDVGHHMGWLQDEASLGVLGAIDYTMPNAREAAVLSGSAGQYLQRCRTLGLRNAVVKLGRDGAAMLRDGVEYHVASPEVRVVDTTGAGDAFDAGFIDALLDGKAPTELLARACACGALSTRAPGALHALPTRNDLDAILQESHAA